MHANIIQLEERPIAEEELCTPSDYFDDHWFLYSVADYVQEDEYHEETLRDFRDIFVPEGELVEYFEDKHGSGLIFHKGFVEAYFNRNFPGFKAALDTLVEKATTENYCSGELSLLLMNLRDAYDDKFGIYIQNKGMSLVTLNEFLRNVTPDTPYYFGGTLDYHA